MPIKFAGKLNAFSRGPRGFFVKLEIGGDDDWQELAAAPLGTTFGVAMVAIDAETGVSKDASPGADTPPRSPDAGKLSVEAGKADKPRRPFHEMSRAQQAGILCGDQTFKLWLSTAYPNTANMVDCADAVRLLCGVHSRAELSEDRVAGKKWDRIVTHFHETTGRLAEVRG
jgi:hypothetical protein